MQGGETMRIVIVSDAWRPQINGVVTTISQTSKQLIQLGHQVSVLSPEGHRSVPCPFYKDIRLSVFTRRKVTRFLEAAAPDAIHIATEGPLGLAARSWCLRNEYPFSTSYHTRFPEYIRMRVPIPLALSYGWLRRFHGAAQVTMVRSMSQKTLLEARGFSNLQLWPGAVDTELFRPRGKDALDLPRPVAMYMGRVAAEKGLDQFLDLDLPGSQVVIGDGPELRPLKRRYPLAHFLGPKYGEELASLVSSADVFVFPSRTDTLGLAMLEALACGVPVAAFPVPGPQDLIREGSTGALDEDLKSAIFRAFRLDSESCVEFAQNHSWLRSTRRFVSHLQPLHPVKLPSTNLLSA
jgi:glycosyltransferase involved in cell wall biosynthesis